MEGGTQVSDIPTPETDASTFDPYTWNQNGLGRSYSPEVMYPIDDGEWVPIDKTRDLDNEEVRSRMEQALTLTAPKQ